ncbi:hypothetical protein KJ807_05555 [Patescibacteria group bacterium]|nr:hypothetical protein [Patescibacteria group bacterium]
MATEHIYETNFSNWIDAHYADGKIAWKHQAFCPETQQMLLRITKSSPLCMRSFLQQTYEGLFRYMSPLAKNSFDRISTGNGNDVEGFDARALLIYLVLFSDVDRDLIAEQLHDMSLTHGLCPSGRVNRLLQLYETEM